VDQHLEFGRRNRRGFTTAVKVRRPEIKRRCLVIRIPPLWTFASAGPVSIGATQGSIVAPFIDTGASANAIDARRSAGNSFR
jgi:hypothetical protein